MNLGGMWYAVETLRKSKIDDDLSELIKGAKQALLYIENKALASNRPLSDWKSYHSLKSKVTLHDRRIKLRKINGK